MSIDNEWKDFLDESIDPYAETENNVEEYETSDVCENNKHAQFKASDIPKATDIYISTKTKISYFNMPIDLKTIFWKIQVMRYSTQKEGVIKKQMKFNSLVKEDYLAIQENLKQEYLYDEHIITHIENVTGRNLFKDIRKVSIGVCKKDLLSYRSKKKSAFYNCFVLIIRLLDDTCNYKEYHVKVFNTGKIEIPGVQDEVLFQRVLLLLIDIIQPHLSVKLEYKSNISETVLINSNFKCGFYINREVLYDILKYRYNIQTIYDPCSYPGIQCKFYYNPDIGIQTGSQISEDNKDKDNYNNISEVSFMIFRTGSILIVGRCEEFVIREIYEFLKKILVLEYKEICEHNTDLVTPIKIKNKKKRKHEVIMDDT